MWAVKNLSSENPQAVCPGRQCWVVEMGAVKHWETKTWKFQAMWWTWRYFKGSDAQTVHTSVYLEFLTCIYLAFCTHGFLWWSLMFHWGFFYCDQLLSHHFQRNNKSSVSLKNVTALQNAHLCAGSGIFSAMCFFCLFSLFYLYFHFISYLIAKSLIILQSYLYPKKSCVWYKLHCCPAASSFKELKPILDAHDKHFWVCILPKLWSCWLWVFFVLFFLERKIFIWKANMLPDKLILISGQEGGVMTKAASLHCNLVEVLSDCDVRLALCLWYKPIKFTLTVLCKYYWQFKFTSFFCNFIYGDQCFTGFVTLLSQVEF